MFSWVSKKQTTVAQSTAEAEYVAAAKATSQAIWLRRILEDKGEKQDEPTKAEAIKDKTTLRKNSQVLRDIPTWLASRAHDSTVKHPLQHKKTLCFEPN